MTSWLKRIENVDKVVQSLLNNNIKPYKIYCYLSSDEFDGYELPEKLLKLEKDNDNFNIVWVKENTYTFKKLIPTIKKHFNDKDIKIISVDDDWIYGTFFINYMCEISNKYPDCIISPNGSPLGSYTLYKPKFFDERLWLCLTNDIINLKVDDRWYKTCLKLNNINGYGDLNIKMFISRPKNFNNDPLNIIYKQYGYKEKVDNAFNDINFDI